MSAPSLAAATPVEDAWRAAADAAVRADVDVVPLRGAADSHRAADLICRIWQADTQHPPLPANVIRAIEHSGGYLHGVEDGEGELRGVCVGFLGLHDGRMCLHSHITGVLAGGQGRGLGAALKTHQRAWCLERGIGLIAWTFDPLVRRNAHFNLRRLGARPDAYVADFYGPMTDGLNQGDPSDRLHAVWELSGAPLEVDPGLATPLLRVAPDGSPERLADTGARVASVTVPADIEALRLSDPAAATAWRLAVREALGGLMQAGGRVAGFTDDLGYLVDRD